MNYHIEDVPYKFTRIQAKENGVQRHVANVCLVAKHQEEIILDDLPGQDFYIALMVL